MKSVLVIGGGLAGLAAAARLATTGHRVTILESRQRLGGRAGSFTHPQSGQLVDACQHVSMGCCTEFARFAKLVGIEHFLKPEPILWFMTPDRRVTRFAADSLPAPFHLSRAFARVHYLTWGDKLRIAWGLACLRLINPEDDRPLLPWLQKHRQNERTIKRFWGIVLVSALNESVDRVGLKYARKVFVDAFLRDRRGFEVQVPTVPLGRLYGEELSAWFAKNGVSVEFNARVTGSTVEGNRLTGVTLRDGSLRVADDYVSAVPWNRLADWLSIEILPSAGAFQPSPITSVHLWFDRSIMDLPHVVLVDCSGQWVFNRGEVSPGEWYVQVVISASGEMRAMGHEKVESTIVEEMRSLFPAAQKARLLRAKVITEHAATFVPIPGIDTHRPGPVTKLENLFLAGDWTATGWPATMEGAVRSGFRAADVLAKTR
ncbi:hydroxysqualene dehydroxylase HpnE [Zavarzinella formosa]|uniref:hydroxysqualene dehydroxylase HpnE n=1 Tax=Zavarzinella formosa TaxID=360055 RepID=UPI0002E6BA68|nr:hydroxysqualene dehydroxylase HpnE [Zavarzinella formosa]